MPLERITDDNYHSFKSAENAILIASLSWCVPCMAYKPVVEVVANEFEGTRFGEAILDEGGLIKFKLDHNIDATPTTLALKYGKIVFQKSGIFDYDGLSNIVKGLQTLFSTVYIPIGDGNYVAARVEGMRNEGGVALYHLSLLEESSLGHIGQLGELPKESIVHKKSLKASM